MQIGCSIHSLIVLLAATAGCGQRQPAAPGATQGNQNNATQVSNDKVPQRQDDAVLIPLNRIWGYQMPGTREIQALEPNAFGEMAQRLPPTERERRVSESLISQLAERLSTHSNKQQQAQPGFAVLGSGIEALREAHAVLVKNEKPRDRFPYRSDVSLVFFSYSSSYYAHLKRVKLRVQTIDIEYQMVPHKTREMTVHFAIIPLGNMASGSFSVHVDQLPLDSEFVDGGFRSITSDEADVIICHPFSFSVKREDEERGTGP
jgi:hypothetical protein